ncbi:hypothetical protein Ac2012v2_008061 [Leucoagaricus gongylophorus]
MVSNTTHGDNLSIQTQPILTSHLSASANVSAKALTEADVVLTCDIVVLEEHGRVRSGAINPLSLANCSRQIGRNSVNDTITNTSLKDKMISGYSS